MFLGSKGAYVRVLAFVLQRAGVVAGLLGFGLGRLWLCTGLWEFRVHILSIVWVG